MVDHIFPVTLSRVIVSCSGRSSVFTRISIFVIDWMIGITSVRPGSSTPVNLPSMKRTPQLPGVPTLDESGYPGFEANAWYALLLPARTPPAIW